MSSFVSPSDPCMNPLILFQNSDKSIAPSYKFIREKDDPDTCLLVFTAGPPYEDIAFKIVDREWEYSHKR